MSKRVLIVDDDEATSRLLCLILSDHETIPVTKGFEHITTEVDWSSIDVVVVDRLLGIQDGMSLLRWIRKEHPNIRRIMLTGDNSVEPATSPADIVMFKPPDIDKLREAIDG